MSMHSIEDMMESSIRLLHYNGSDTIDGVHVRDICRNLYRLQDKCDCSYTVLRVKDELKSLGYLKNFSMDDLPADERAAAKNLENSRFLKGAYIATDGQVYVPYASEMWNTLEKCGIIPPSKARPKKLNAFKLAKLLFPIADTQSKTAGAEGDNAKRFLIYWYTYLPSFLYIDDCKRVNKTALAGLRDMSGISETFALAEELGLTDELEDLENMADDYEMPYLKGYADPYIAWRDSDDGIVIDEQELQEKATLYWLQKQYAKADKFAARLPEPSATVFRSTIILSHCAEILASGKMDRYPFSELAVANVQIMQSEHSGFSVWQAKKALSELVETCSETSAETAMFHTLLAQCHFFLNEWDEGTKTLKAACDVLFAEANENASAASLAELTAAYYQAIINFCPLSVLGDLPLPEKILSITQAKQALLEKAASEGPAVALCVRIAVLYLVEGDLGQAAAWLDNIKERDEKGIHSLSAVLVDRKLNMAKITRLTADLENEKNLVRKYILGLQLAYYKTGQSRQWREFEAVYRGASEEDIASVKARYPDMPESLTALLEAVDGTYYREYAGEEVTFYFLGSNLGDLPYYLLSAKQIESKRSGKVWLEEFIVDEKITDEADKICWLHFADCMNNGGSSQLYIDFSPSEKGKKGQIICYEHDPDTLTVIADSFDDYLQMLIRNDYNFVLADD